MYVEYLLDINPRPRHGLPDRSEQHVRHRFGLGDHEVVGGAQMTYSSSQARGLSELAASVS